MNKRIIEFVRGMQEGESYLHCALNVANIEGVIFANTNYYFLIIYIITHNKQILL